MVMVTVLWSHFSSNEKTRLAAGYGSAFSVSVLERTPAPRVYAHNMMVMHGNRGE